MVSCILGVLQSATHQCASLLDNRFYNDSEPKWKREYLPKIMSPVDEVKVWHPFHALHCRRFEISVCEEVLQHL
ncbi:hypothetical protein F5Y17DRAFT_439534 [Xylariaceae sp. FL0594]|nr:hypothetical protein F5Y17DRAFT_439534 [Xylariaceae sp. FL0594]